MALKIVRNDITKMNTEAIVNTANSAPVVGPGCDYAIYQSAGCEELLKYRTEKIGSVPEGQVFITPAFHLNCKYIIHAVSPLYSSDASVQKHLSESPSDSDTPEALLRACYQNSLQLAARYHIRSIAFPLIATGSFHFPKEEGFRIAVDEITSYLSQQGSDLMVYLVVFDEKATALGRQIKPDLESYIDQNYVEQRHAEEQFFYTPTVRNDTPAPNASSSAVPSFRRLFRRRKKTKSDLDEYAPRSFPEYPDHVAENSTYHTKRDIGFEPKDGFCPAKYGIESAPEDNISSSKYGIESAPEDSVSRSKYGIESEPEECVFDEDHETALKERMKHMSDTFSEYLIYLIESRNMSYPDVYKRAIVDKKAFSKIKNNPDAHPKKITAMCLCIGAKLNMDQTRDLLARAGYALSPCDKTDIIFSYFIENEIYDMIELDIQLEEHGLPCLIA